MTNIKNSLAYEKLCTILMNDEEGVWISRVDAIMLIDMIDELAKPRELSNRQFGDRFARALTSLDVPEQTRKAWIEGSWDLTEGNDK